MLAKSPNTGKQVSTDSSMLGKILQFKRHSKSNRMKTSHKSEKCIELAP